MPFFLKRLLLVAGIAVSFAACSTPSGTPGPGENENGPEGPPATSADQGNLETIAILGTNDIHGGLAPMDLKTREAAGVPAVDYQAGGMAYLASYIRQLRHNLGDRLIWLDGGDEFQGTIESNTNRGAAMVAFFNLNHLTAAAVGNHEFDFGAEGPDLDDRLSSLKHRMSEAHYPYLDANVLDARTGEREKLPNSQARMLVDAGRVKVGIIGLSTLETPKTTRPENIVSLKFGALKDATIREAKNLRDEGAQVVLLTAHVGLSCEAGGASTGHSLRKQSDPQGACHRDGEMVQLLKAIPPGTVDAVVSGHTHTVVHHWVNGTPVIQGGASGRYFNIIYLNYDLTRRKLVTDRTRIEGPVPVCPKVFAHQGDCNGDRPAPKLGRGELTEPTFHREKILADRDTQALLDPVFEAAKAAKNEVYGNAARAIEHVRNGESPLGDLIADALRAGTKSDIALINAGGVRAGIEQGPITYGEIFRTLPFDNTVVQLHVSGKELRNLLQVAESGARGFPPVSGVTLKLIDPDSDAPGSDLDGDGKVEPWEVNRLLEVKLPDGTLLDDKKQYTFATIDFLVSGGDDFAWPMSQIPEAHRTGTGVMMRDSVAAYIKGLSASQGAINSPEHPALDPAHPRMVFVKVKTKEPGKKGRRHRRRHRR